jgi:lysyl-tRNA synthetase class 2
MIAADDWRPTASRASLQLRAALLERARHFFAARGVLEVDTPLVVNAGVTDVHIHSARVSFTGETAQPGGGYFLHTSPEYAMKRLLAAGSGDIYQICHVVRALERGRLHNAEFTLVEWYRVGFSLEALMNEVEWLVRDLLGTRAAGLAGERIPYRDAFLQEMGIDPFTAELTGLVEAAQTCGYQPTQQPDRDELLELLMSARVGPALGRGRLTFVHRYPASQAALARLDPADGRAALRFELYCEGVELANGFDELASGAEQRARFEADARERARTGLPPIAPDERLLAALAAGLPPCAGVALGFDRTLMLAAGADRIDDVLPFPIERA